MEDDDFVLGCYVYNIKLLSILLVVIHHIRVSISSYVYALSYNALIKIIYYFIYC